MTDRLLRQLLEWRDYEYCEGEQPHELLTNAFEYAHDLLTTANTYKDKVAELEAELSALKRGEFICQKCGLRKDAEFEPGDF